MSDAPRVVRQITLTEFQDGVYTGTVAIWGWTARGRGIIFTASAEGESIRDVLDGLQEQAESEGVEW